MLHRSLKTKLEKAGYTVKNVDNGNYNFYSCAGESYIVGWYKQDETAQCVQIRGHNDHNDSSSDYSAGFFTDTIKTVVEYLGLVE